MGHVHAFHFRSGVGIQSARAAMRKSYRLGGLNIRNGLSQFWRLEVQDEDVGRSPSL